MGMSVGGKGQKAEINVTPMIDVLLVLIIIFLVITPSVPRGLNTLLPQQSTQPAEESTAPSEIVVSVHRGGMYQLNQESMDFATLQGRLANLFKNGASQVIFVRGDKDLEFREVAQVIDMARGSGVNRVALMTN